MATTDAAVRVVVCDAGPLIHLDELDCLDLLSDFADVVVPKAVWSEVVRHRPAVFTRAGIPIREVSVGGVVPPDIAALARLLSLDAGELEALQAFRETGAELMLSDDSAARLAARHMQIPVHGTIGILLRSIRRGRKTPSEVIQILQMLHSISTLHVRRTLVEEVIRKVELELK